MSEKLDLYLRLERIMSELDDQKDPFADRIRDAMDALWFVMSSEEHEVLDAR